MVIPGEPATNPIPTQVEDRLLQIDAILLELDALIEIPDNELASLRRDLAALSGTTATVEEEENELFLENQIPETQLIEDDVVSVDGDDITSTQYESEPIVDDTPAVVARVSEDQDIFEILLSKVSNFSVWIGMALLMSLATLMWFMRRAARRHKEQITLGLDELDAKSDETPHPVIVTEKSEPAVPEDEDTIVVVETELAEKPRPPDLDDTQEVPIIQDASALALSSIKEETVTSADGSFDLTNMNEAIGAPVSNAKTLNLDQNDPVAEAEFHMAYGLYDQATDLINEALSKDPDSTDLLAKLCEIYFVWGNRDAFIEAALRLQSLVGIESNSEWDKIKIMGHQIAADHEMFVGDITDDHLNPSDSSSDSDFEESLDLGVDINLEEYEIKADDISDFDIDGEYQLLVGSKRGYLYYYDDIDENIGGSFHLVDSIVDNIAIGSHTAPTVTNLNGDNRLELVLGNRRGGVVLFESAPTNNIGIAVHDEKLFYEIFPNPSKELVNINLGSISSNELKRTSIQIYTLTGDLILTVHPAENLVKIDVEKFAKGTYIINVINEVQSSQEKLILR